MSERAYDAIHEETRIAGELGRLVRARRAEVGLTQIQLAERAGMTQPQVSRLEAGGASPTLPVLDRLARALDSDLIITLAPHADRQGAGAEAADQ